MFVLLLLGNQTADCLQIFTVVPWCPRDYFRLIKIWSRGYGGIFAFLGIWGCERVEEVLGLAGFGSESGVLGGYDVRWVGSGRMERMGGKESTGWADLLVCL